MDIVKETMNKVYLDLYGCHQDAIDASVRISFMGDAGMAVMSILSDAQEMLNLADSANGKEEVRKFINRAKYIIAMTMKTESK